jgi:ATP-dependent helicase/nuclease subunit A
MTPPDQPQRLRILRDLDRNMLVEAAAGTGKTTSMVGRMVELLRSGRCDRVRRMAAVTFTRKAAAELRARFRAALEQAVHQCGGDDPAPARGEIGRSAPARGGASPLPSARSDFGRSAPARGEIGRSAPARGGASPLPSARRNLARALAEVEQGFVGTIHAFCARLLRERPVEARLDPAFEEIDEQQDRRLRLEAWEEFVTRQLAGETPGLLELLDHLGLSLGELRSAFLAFADYPDVTTWPTRARALPDLAPVIRAVRGYVGHMRDLASLLPTHAGTDTLIPAYRNLPRILAHHEPLDPHAPRELMELLARFRPKRMVRYTLWVQSGNFDKQQVFAEQRRWEAMREIAERCLNAWHEHRYGPVLDILHRARLSYDRLRRERGQLSFSDLLLCAARLLQSPHVRRYFSGRFTHLLVDEFQDTDPVQAEVLLQLAARDADEPDWRRCVPRPGSLFVVGDPKQSIYRFRRADIVTYNQVREIVERTGGAVVQLSTNFRADGPLVEWVNRFFAGRFPAAPTAESPAYVPMLTAPGGGPGLSAPGLSGVRVLTVPADCSRTNAATVEEEAGRVARAIEDLLGGGPAPCSQGGVVFGGQTVRRSPAELAAGRGPALSPADVMIIAHRRANLSVYARRLAELGIPHRVTGGTSLNEVPELRLLHLCLGALTWPEDELATVALLRSELFGVSDVDLYRFRRAGGRFSFRHPAPAAAPVIGEALERLRRYARWLERGVPPLAVVERLCGELGLGPRAAARRGGDLDAGSLAKGLELLRGAHRRSWTLAQTVGYLGQLVDGLELHDGLPARADPSDDVVRVMNLHKAKGLEAKVVFLVDPTGVFKHEVGLHVDRAGGDAESGVLGYLTIRGERLGSRVPKVVARPAGWAKIEEREQRFLDAEALRLLYVAATRAGCLLVITQRERANHRNPWAAFAPALATELRHLRSGPQEREDPQFAVPGELPRPMEASVNVNANANADAAPPETELAARLARLQTPTYLLRTARAHSRATHPPPRVELEAADAAERADGEHGVEWGAAIHELLQAAIVLEPGAGLQRLAGSILVEHGLDAGLSDAAARVVEQVRSSEIWRRARRAPRRLTEVPFQLLDRDGSGLEVVVRGVIDLVFEEPDGWVVVDYKTDRLAGESVEPVIARHGPQVQLYGRAWSRCTGARVKEVGLVLLGAGGVFVSC